MDHEMREIVPKGLQYILEVYCSVHHSHQSRINAVKKVARKHRLDHQTISAACTRSIGINTNEFDNFLIPQNAQSFCDHLVKRFPSFRKQIEVFFAKQEGGTGFSSEKTLDISRPLFPEEAKNILTMLLLKEVKNKLREWLEINNLPFNLKIQMEELKGRLEEI